MKKITTGKLDQTKFYLLYTTTKSSKEFYIFRYIGSEMYLYYSCNCSYDLNENKTVYLNPDFRKYEFTETKLFNHLNLYTSGLYELTTDESNTIVIDHL